MILIALAAAAMCPPFDTVCLDAEVARLEREIARQNRESEFILRMYKLCSQPEESPYPVLRSRKEYALQGAKLRACLARHRKEYEAMGLTP